MNSASQLPISAPVGRSQPGAGRQIRAAASHRICCRWRAGSPRSCMDGPSRSSSSASRGSSARSSRAHPSPFADAIACARRRAAAHDDERAVLLHGDVHQWNALRSAEGFKLVDPDGRLDEPEYDLGVIMREDPVELMTGDPFERARWLAARTGLDAAAIWEWGVAERVSCGLLATKVGLQPVGCEMLAAADYLAGLTEAAP